MPKKRHANHDSWDPKAVTKKFKATRGTELDEVLVIGIDFGTTYSGVGWATAEDFGNDQINFITNWPDADLEEVKVPTTLVYKPDGTQSWGYQVPFEDKDRLSWFKLLLLRDEDVPREIKESEPLQRARQLLDKLGKTPVEVIADYLRNLWGHTLEIIAKARSSTLVDALKFHVVLTVPASWKNYARRAMKDAAKRAGITSDRPAGETVLSFAMEPEAATLATIWEKERHLKADDVYMICDAGGGTVDIITYKVGNLDPIELHEAAGGEAGICGGMFIDEKFRLICKARLGRHWFNLTLKGIGEIMHSQWEHGTKTIFSLKNDKKKYIISVPAEAFATKNDMNDQSREPKIIDGRIYFSVSDIQKAFDESFAKIGDLVSRQISKSAPYPVTAIILVGGLGSSPYLYEYLSKKYKGKPEVLQAGGTKPRSAICRGAVYKGFMDRLNGNPNGLSARAHMSVVSTIARLSLGVDYSERFIEGVHRNEDKYWGRLEGKWMARRQMLWYLKKGDVVMTAEPVKHNFYHIFEKDSHKKGMAMDLLQCELDNPPKRRDSSVTTMGQMSCQISHLVKDFDLYIAPTDEKCKRMNYEVEMVPSGASTVFAVYFKGKQLGTHECQLDLT
ncbi:unnamed protein product [Clonostachys chloroleuca]|uniref:Actin-like ATPase domain-containing protein n=1 Tax=Clonostachys chloroleuca TaxID=1926264 RepID=A0AA35PXM7_9HYPO|nr:unnamed protein product [Clonostachys chloroleuca]